MQSPTIVHMIASPLRSAPREVMYRLVDAIDRDRFQPAVAFLRHGSEEADEFGVGDMLPDFEALGIPVFCGTMERKHQVHDTARLNHFLRGIGARMIVSHLPRADMWATAMAWWGRIRNVRLLHGNWAWWHYAEHRVRHGDKAMQELDRFLLRHTDRVVSVSPGMLTALREQQKVPADKLVWIRTGIDVERFRVAAPPFAGDRPLTFGMITRVLESKGVFEFVAAVAAVQKHRPEVRAIVAGGGPDIEQARIRAAELGAAIEFCGHVNDVTEVLGSIDVFVLPSWMEGTPLSLLEALAAGRLPVVTRVGGMPYVVDDGRNGIVVEPRDVQALIAAFERIASEPGWARGLAAGALADSGQYSLEQMARSWDAFYEDVLNSRT